MNILLFPHLVELFTLKTKYIKGQFFVKCIELKAFSNI